MDTLVCSGIAAALLILWYLLEKRVMTPYDLYNKWKSNISYVAPEEAAIKLAKTRATIRAVQDIFDSHGPNTDAGAEAVEVLQKLRKYERELLLKR